MKFQIYSKCYLSKFRARKFIKKTNLKGKFNLTSFDNRDKLHLKH